MRFIKTFIILSVLLNTALGLSAQTRRRAKRPTAYEIYTDSVFNAFVEKINALNIEAVADSDSTEIVLTPYLYRIVEPNVYYSQSVRHSFALDWQSEYPKHDSVDNLTEGMIYRDRFNGVVDEALMFAYLAHPNNFDYHEDVFRKVDVLAEASITKKKEDVDTILKSAPVINDVSVVIGDDSDFDFRSVRPNFWKTNGKFTTQFTQNYFSKNWYKGGNNNATLLSTLLLEAHYNDQNKIQWDNKADLRLGFVSAPSDTCHSYLTNNDKIYLYTKLGVKASKAWYYTIQAELNTQFMPGYRTNQKKTFSKFLAPLDVYVSIGMDLKPNVKNGDLSIALLPLSYKYRLISSDDDEFTIHKNYNMKKNDDGSYRNNQHDFGSKMEMNFRYNLAKNLQFRSRLYYYTNYKYAESEWENALSFQFNKYISTEVNSLWRFDDNRSPNTKDEKIGYFQFKEYFTFGLSYNF